MATTVSAVVCRLICPGGGGGGGLPVAGGKPGVMTGIGGGGRLFRFPEDVGGEEGRDPSTRGDRRGDRALRSPTCSRSLSLAPPESSSSDSDPSVGDLSSAGGGGGGARAAMEAFQHILILIS